MAKMDFGIGLGAELRFDDVAFGLLGANARESGGRGELYRRRGLQSNHCARHRTILIGSSGVG